MNRKIKIRHIYKATELKRFKELEGKYHHMGETHSGGDTMRIVFEDENGKWLALMVWGSACYHLRPRDEYIGWNMALRRARQKLVVNNRRFTILARPGEHPNLASQCLGLALRELPRMWLKKFHYRPLLAETFCDIKHSSGTCYKAANWIPLGMTKGFTRVNRQECDFYIPNDSPKTIWVAPFVRNAVELLNSPNLPDEYLEGAHCDADGILPVSPNQAESLYDAMRGVKDWRDDNKSIPAAAMLSIVVMAVMSGANSVKAVWRFGERLTMAQRRLLCLRHDKDRFGAPLKAYFKVPSYVTFYKFLRKLDLVDFGEKLSAWLQSQEGTLPRRLALDGKSVKEVMGVVTMVDCETGAPVAVAASRRKEGTVGECELPKGQKLIRDQDLTNALVCADALHGQQETARDIHNANGNYLLQIKGNQATILRNAENLVKARKPMDAKKKVESNRSRIETRVTRAYALDDPVQLGLFGAHTLVRTWRKTEYLAGKLKGTTSEDVSYHASSVRIDARHDASFFGEWVRGEWSVEKYHARRDGTYCEDIRTRRCDGNATGALMLARTMALYFFSKSGMENCQAFKEEMQRNPDKVFDLVMGNDA